MVIYMVYVAPKIDNRIIDAIENSYGRDYLYCETSLLKEAIADLENELGLKKKNGYFAPTRCVDEKTGYFTKMISKDFNDLSMNIGGVGGIPRKGLENLVAGHVPDSGWILNIAYPHTGIYLDAQDEDIHYGKILRPGQKKLTPCCGAVEHYIERLIRSNVAEPKEDDIRDIGCENHVLEKALYNKKNEILSSSNPSVAATMALYNTIDHKASKLASFWSQNVDILTVKCIEFDISSNGSKKNKHHTLISPKKITYRQKGSEKSKDLTNDFTDIISNQY